LVLKQKCLEATPRQTNENKDMRERLANCRPALHIQYPSSIQTILSVPEFNRFNPF